MTKSEQNKAIADTILQQLGGQKFIVMTGANSFSYGDNNLNFRLSSRITKHKAQCMRITLNGKDLYDLELMKIKNFELKLVDKKTDVDAEALQGVFTEMTGLDTSIGEVRMMRRG